jgi:sirohydrochlorin ferrochelatase
VTSPALPVLLVASHGTRNDAARIAVLALVDAVTTRMTAQDPAPRVIAGFIDVQQPDVPTCLADAEPGAPVVIVPLLMSAGYHVAFDLANAVAVARPRDVRVTAALGPDPRLAGIVAARLAECGLRDGDQVVLAAAGSSDANAIADCLTAGRQLAEVLHRDVTVGFIAAAHPTLAEAVADVRAQSPGARVVVASYLLAPGTFAEMSRRAGADVVSGTILAEGQAPPSALVDVVVDRYRAAT